MLTETVAAKLISFQMAVAQPFKNFLQSSKDDQGQVLHEIYKIRIRYASGYKDTRLRRVSVYPKTEWPLIL